MHLMQWNATNSIWCNKMPKFWQHVTKMHKNWEQNADENAAKMQENVTNFTNFTKCNRTQPIPDVMDLFINGVSPFHHFMLKVVFKFHFHILFPHLISTFFSKFYYYFFHIWLFRTFKSTVILFHLIFHFIFIISFID